MRLRIAIIALALAGSLAAARQDQQARVYVAVVDAAGKPDTTRPSESFLVWEDGLARRVMAAGPATQPLSVVVIVYGVMRADTEGGRAAIRGAIDVFQQAPGTRLSVITGTETPKLAAVDGHAKALDDIVTHFVGTGPGLLIFDGVLEATRLLAKEQSDRRAILIVADSTRKDPDTRNSLQTVADAVKKVGASIWAVDFIPDFASTRPPGTQRMNSEQDQLMNEFAFATGGSSNRIVGTTAVGEGVAAIARVMTAQYVVDYERPAREKPKAVRIGVRMPAGFTALAPQWPLR